MSDRVLEKLDGVKAIERLLAYQDVGLAGQRNASYDREMVRVSATHGGPVCGLGGVRPDLTRKEVEARFVHENKGAVLATCFRLESRPDL